MEKEIDVDFNRPIQREGTHAEKYEARLELFGREDVLPMWVADMDLPTPPFVLDAIRQRLDHPILGYTAMSDQSYQAIIDWQAQHDYAVSREQIVFTHNVANGLFLAVRALTRPGDAVLIQPPIYPPFYKAVQMNDRELVTAPLVLDDGQYQIDFEVFEQAVVQHKVKLFLLCNPHNPAGRVWSKTDLLRLSQICLRHQVTMVSDEIHSDLVYAPHRHTPLASLSPQVASQTLTLSSPGKTFNLAGLQIGYGVSANPKIKQAFELEAHKVKIHDLNLFAMVALEAAYSEQGKSWRDKLLVHFQSNIALLKSFFARHFPAVKVINPQASYLVWLDFRAMFSDHQVLKSWLINQAKLGLNDGLSYGEPGRGFMRINIAVSQPTLQQAFDQLLSAKGDSNGPLS